MLTRVPPPSARAGTRQMIALHGAGRARHHRGMGQATGML